MRLISNEELLYVAGGGDEDQGDEDGGAEDSFDSPDGPQKSKNNIKGGSGNTPKEETPDEAYHRKMQERTQTELDEARACRNGMIGGFIAGLPGGLLGVAAGTLGGGIAGGCLK